MNIWYHIFCQTFENIFAKNAKGGSDKNKIWCLEQLGRAEKKVQNSIFVNLLQKKQHSALIAM